MSTKISISKKLSKIKLLKKIENKFDLFRKWNKLYLVGLSFWMALSHRSKQPRQKSFLTHKLHPELAMESAQIQIPKTTSDCDDQLSFCHCFQNTCLLWHNFKTVSKSSYITGESKLEQVSEFCQKIRQIEGGSALLSFNVNTLSRVFSPFVKLSKIEDFWMSWRNNRQS